jgi:hypothetical protein
MNRDSLSFNSDAKGLNDGAKDTPHFTRRRFVQTVGASALGVVALPNVLLGKDGDKATGRASETLVKKLYDSLSDAQKEEVCFDWDYKDDRGVLRTHVSNNWNITAVKEFNVAGKFFSKDQQELIEAIFFGLYNKEWHSKIRQQLKDDAGGYGKKQTIAIFGKPGSGKFEFVMTGRHLTVRCDGDTTDHLAFGGPIFYGHAAQGFNERADHPGNVFWNQALKANALYDMLDGKQRKVALLPRAPGESKVQFRGQAGGAGIPVSELAKDQKGQVTKVLESLIEPYRSIDQQEVKKCLSAHGGLDACSIAFYQSGDIGKDGVWDNWRLEGPAFVWHFRGAPHVHVWVNVSNDPSVKLNARG